MCAAKEASKKVPRHLVWLIFQKTNFFLKPTQDTKQLNKSMIKYEFEKGLKKEKLLVSSHLYTVTQARAKTNKKKL